LFGGDLKGRWALAVTGLPERNGLAVLREVASTLNRDLTPEAILEAVVDLLRDVLPAAQVTLWRRGPGGVEVAGLSSPRQERSAPGLDALPEAPGHLRVPLGHAGHQLGVLEVAPLPTGRPPDPDLCGTVAEVLAPFLDAVLLSEDLAAELATRAREVQEQRRFMNLVIDSLPVGLYVVDRDYRILVWNRKRETGTQGMRRAQVLGRRVFEVLTRLPAAQLRAELDEIFDHGEVVQRELEVGGGEEAEKRFYRLTKVPMRLGGDAVSHVITIGEDITERRAARQRIMQSEKLADGGQLAAGVMHEINNPLATIGACVAAIEARLGEVSDPTAREYLEIIDAEVQRCTGIVDQLLDFSRPRNTAARRKPEDLNALVEQTLFLLKHHARFKRLTVERELDEGLPPVAVDGERLVQAFMAIMLNAADAMERGGILRVRTGRNPGREDELVVGLEDTGVGIPPAALDKIFEPFFTTKPPGRGTGLGLTICYGIIEEQGGRIRVNSQPGLGTTFEIFLPTARGARA
jgi:two-component system, NtrC family, sensor kinase